MKHFGIKAKLIVPCKEKALTPANTSPCKQGSPTVLEEGTRKQPLSTLKILGMQSGSKQHSQVQVNPGHTWMARPPPPLH